MAFDVLAHDGAAQRRRPWSSRRHVLEDLTAGWVPPLQLSPVTRDVDEARRWCADDRAAGIEGPVVKGARTRYAAGRRDCVEVKSRETREVIVGGVIGPLHRPDSLVAGLYECPELVIVGRSTPLSPAQPRDVGALLAAPEDGHPWPEEISSGGFRGSGKIRLTKAEPRVVVEVSANTALQGGRFRHPLRYLRPRADLAPEDVAPLR